MKKIVLALAVWMMAGAMNTMSAAVNANDEVAISVRSIERITYQMADELGLNRAQTIDLFELNNKYYYLFDDHVVMSDRQYRKAWTKYERKLRRILLSGQYTTYLSRRSLIFMHVPHYSYIAPAHHKVVPVAPKHNYGIMPGKGHNRSIVSAPKGNNHRPGVNSAPKRNNHDMNGKGNGNGHKPNVNGKKDGKMDKPQANNAPNKGKSEAYGNGEKHGKSGVTPKDGNEKPQAGSNKNQRRPGADQAGRGVKRSAEKSMNKGKEI